MFAVEYLPGQFDQRADSASECIQLISQGGRPTVRSAKVYALSGALNDADIEAGQALRHQPRSRRARRRLRRRPR